MERKVGERFDYNGVTLEVVKQLGCKGCYRCCIGSRRVTGFCSPKLRKDGKSVIFKLVEP